MESRIHSYEIPAQDLDDAAEESSTLTKSDIVLSLAAQLQPLPATLTRIASLDAEACDLSDVAEAIRMDPVLTVKLLRTANSAFLASSMPASTVDEALMRLGLGIVISMTFALSVGKTMNVGVPAYGLEAGQLWRHSAASAIAADVLVRLAPCEIPPATVTAALLHDIGKLILAQGATPEELAFMRLAREEAGLTIFEAEREVLEMNHAEVGFIVTRHWGLPEGISRAIMYHHSPEQWDNRMGDAVYLANLTAHAIEAKERDEPIIGPNPEVLARLGLAPFDFKGFCTRCAHRFEQLRAVYNA